MTRKVYVLSGASHIDEVATVRKDYAIGDVLSVRNHPGKLIVVRHHPAGSILARPVSAMPEDETTCEGCGDYEACPGHLGPYCLACRRQYPGQEAFDHKGDWWWPEGERR